MFKELLKKKQNKDRQKDNKAWRHNIQGGRIKGRVRDRHKAGERNGHGGKGRGRADTRIYIRRFGEEAGDGAPSFNCDGKRLGSKEGKGEEAGARAPEREVQDARPDTEGGKEGVQEHRCRKGRIYDRIVGLFIEYRARSRMVRRHVDNVKIRSSILLGPSLDVTRPGDKG